MKYFALLGALLFVVACGSSDHGTFINDPAAGAGAGGRLGQAGSTGRSGSGAVSDAGAAGAAEDDPLAPTVEITAPKEVADPNSKGVLTAPQVTVVCSAKASKASGANEVLSSSVEIQMFGADDKQIGMDGTVHATDVTDVYDAIFTLTDVPSGAVYFVCSASDDGTSPKTTSSRVDTFVDHGPEITLKNPAPSSAHALSPAILFKFTVLPAPLSARDTQAGVTTVSLKVNGVEIDDVAAHENPKAPGEYQISIDLSDPATFSPSPTGSVPVRIVATNKRGTVRTSDNSFDVDSTGPVIQIVSPAVPNSFVGGKVTLAFTVTDTPAGVDTAKVEVVLNNKSHLFDLKNGWANPSPNNFSYTFDTHQFDQLGIQLSVNIRATDLAGNPSDGASILYYLDNVPPIIDMEPPAVQEVQYQSPSSSICSVPFLPLGDSPRDLEVVSSVTRPRALLWDVGNSADGQDAFYFSDIDNANTNTVPHLYFQPDTSKPLLKNADPTKHGAICDAIADETLPLVTLVPLATTGLAYFPATATQHDGICGAGSETPQGTGSKPLCNGNSDLNRVIQHEGPQSPPVAVVYVIAPDALQCTGTQFQITNVAPKDGWVCVAVSAIDKTGNRSVSAPLRLCLDSVADLSSPPCATSSVTPPSCVSDCVPPPHFDPTLGLILKPH
ncbi:MAG: hypothetical protein ABIQ16_12360 [Polyangiaceae bacterium]